MDDLISKEQAIDKIKKRLFETAFNNVRIKQKLLIGNIGGEEE